MKKLAIIIAVLTMSTLGHAMQAPRLFNYTQHKFAIPADILSGMKEGEKFVITGVPATTMSELYVNDAQGNPFAQNTSSVYQGAKGPGALTYTVLSAVERQKLQKKAPTIAPAKAQVMPAAAAVATQKGQLMTKPGAILQPQAPPVLAIPAKAKSKPSSTPALQEAKIAQVPAATLVQTQITKAVQPKQVITENSPTIAPVKAQLMPAANTPQKELLPTITEAITQPSSAQENAQEEYTPSWNSNPLYSPLQKPDNTSQENANLKNQVKKLQEDLEKERAKLKNQKEAAEWEESQLKEEQSTMKAHAADVLEKLEDLVDYIDGTAIPENYKQFLGGKIGLIHSDVQKISQ